MLVVEFTHSFNSSCFPLRKLSCLCRCSTHVSAKRLVALGTSSANFMQRVWRIQLPDVGMLEAQLRYLRDVTAAGHSGRFPSQNTSQARNSAVRPFRHFLCSRHSDIRCFKRPFRRDKPTLPPSRPWPLQALFCQGQPANDHVFLAL